MDLSLAIGLVVRREFDQLIDADLKAASARA